MGVDLGGATGTGFAKMRGRPALLARIAALFLAAVLAACAPQTAGPSGEAATLGTGWGEGRASQARGLNLRRESNRPLGVAEIRYSASAASGRRMDGIELVPGAVGMRILRDNGRPWPLVEAQAGPHLQGRSGERYQLEFTNHSATQTYEIVATVDGIDVVSGAAGNLANRGHVLRAGETIGITGYRKNAGEVAAFRFADPAQSYAAQSKAGSVANLGVIGVGVFALETPPLLRGAPPPASASAACGAGGPCAFPANAGGAR